MHYLGLHGTKLDDDAVGLICRHLKQLEHVDLGGCARITSNALLHLQGKLDGRGNRARSTR